MQLKAISVYLQNKLRMPARRKMSANQGLYKQKGPLIKAGSFQPQRISKNFFERQLKLFYLYIAERSRCSAVQPLQANLSLSWDFSLLVLCEPRRYHNSVRSLFVVGPLRQVDFRRTYTSIFLPLQTTLIFFQTPSGTVVSNSGGTCPNIAPLWVIGLFA